MKTYIKKNVKYIIKNKTKKRRGGSNTHLSDTQQQIIKNTIRNILNEKKSIIENKSHSLKNYKGGAGEGEDGPSSQEYNISQMIQPEAPPTFTFTPYQLNSGHANYPYKIEEVVRALDRPPVKAPGSQARTSPEEISKRIFELVVKKLTSTGKVISSTYYLRTLIKDTIPQMQRHTINPSIWLSFIRGARYVGSIQDPIIQQRELFNLIGRAQIALAVMRRRQLSKSHVLTSTQTFIKNAMTVLHCDILPPSSLSYARGIGDLNLEGFTSMGIVPLRDGRATLDTFRPSMTYAMLDPNALEAWKSQQFLKLTTVTGGVQPVVSSSTQLLAVARSSRSPHTIEGALTNLATEGTRDHLVNGQSQRQLVDRIKQRGELWKNEIEKQHKEAIAKCRSEDGSVDECSTIDLMYNAAITRTRLCLTFLLHYEFNSHLFYFRGGAGGEPAHNSLLGSSGPDGTTAGAMLCIEARMLADAIDRVGTQEIIRIIMDFLPKQFSEEAIVQVFTHNPEGIRTILISLINDKSPPELIYDVKTGNYYLGGTLITSNNKGNKMLTYNPPYNQVPYNQAEQHLPVMSRKHIHKMNSFMHKVLPLLRFPSKVIIDSYNIFVNLHSDLFKIYPDYMHIIFLLKVAYFMLITNKFNNNSLIGGSLTRDPASGKVIMEFEKAGDIGKLGNALDVFVALEMVVSAAPAIPRINLVIKEGSDFSKYQDRLEELIYGDVLSNYHLIARQGVSILLHGKEGPILYVRFVDSPLPKNFENYAPYNYGWMSYNITSYDIPEILREYISDIFNHNEAFTPLVDGFIGKLVVGLQSGNILGVHCTGFSATVYKLIGYMSDLYNFENFKARVRNMVAYCWGPDTTHINYTFHGTPVEIDLSEELGVSYYNLLYFVGSSNQKAYLAQASQMKTNIRKFLVANPDVFRVLVICIELAAIADDNIRPYLKNTHLQGMQITDIMRQLQDVLETGNHADIIATYDAYITSGRKTQTNNVAAFLKSTAATPQSSLGGPAAPKKAIPAKSSTEPAVVKSTKAPKGKPKP